jgi:hypothetical protein
VPRSSAEAAIYDAERPIHAAHARLIQLVEINTSMARHASVRLPVPEAQACLEGIKDDFARIKAKFSEALKIMAAEAARLIILEYERDEAAREERAIDRDFRMWTATLPRKVGAA